MKTRSKRYISMDVLEDKENYSPNRNIAETDERSGSNETPSFCRSIASISPLSPRSRRSSFGTPLPTNSVGIDSYLSPLSTGFSVNRSINRSTVNSTNDTPFSSSSVRDHDNWRRRKINTVGNHDGNGSSSENASPLSVGFSKFYNYHEHNNHHHSKDFKEDIDSMSANTSMTTDDPSFISVASIDHRDTLGKETTTSRSYISRFVSPTHAVHKLLIGNDNDMTNMGRISGREEFTNCKQNAVHGKIDGDEDEEEERGLSLRKMMQTRAFTVCLFFFVIILIFSSYKTMYPQSFIRDDIFPNLSYSSNDSSKSWRLNLDNSLWNDLFFSMQKGKNISTQNIDSTDVSKNAAGAASSCSASGICILTNGFHKAGEIKEIKRRVGISNKYDRKDIYPNPTATATHASLQNVEAQTIKVFKVTVKAADGVTTNSDKLKANRVIVQHPIKSVVQTVPKDVVSSVKSTRTLPSMVVGDVEMWPTHAPTVAVNMIQQFNERMSLPSMVVGNVELWPTHAPTSAVAMIEAFHAKQSLPSMKVGEVQLYPTIAPTRAVQIIQDFNMKQIVKEAQHKIARSNSVRSSSSKLNIPAIGVTPLLPRNTMKQKERRQQFSSINLNNNAFFEVAFGAARSHIEDLNALSFGESDEDEKSHSVAMMKVNVAPFTSLPEDSMTMASNNYYHHQHRNEILKELEPLLKDATFYIDSSNNTSSWKDAPQEFQLTIHPLCRAKSKTAIDLLLSVDVFNSQEASSATLFTSGQVLRPSLISVEYGFDVEHEGVMKEDQGEESIGDNNNNNDSSDSSDHDSVSVSMPSSPYTDYIPFKLDLVPYDALDMDILRKEMEGTKKKQPFEYKVLPVKRTGVISMDNSGYYKHKRPSFLLPKVLNSYTSGKQVVPDTSVRDNTTPYSALVYRRQNSLMSLRSLNMAFNFNIYKFGNLFEEAPTIAKVDKSLSRKQGVQSTIALSILSQRRDIPCFEEKDTWALVTGNDGADSSFPNRLQLETEHRLTYTAIVEPAPMIKDAQDMIKEYIHNIGSPEGLQHIHREKLSLIASENQRNGYATFDRKRKVTKLNIQRSWINKILLNVLKSFSLPIMVVIFFLTLSKQIFIKPIQAEIKT